MTEQRPRGASLWLIVGTMVQIGAFLVGQSGRESLETAAILMAVLGTLSVAVGLWMVLRRSGLSLAWCLVCVVPLVALWIAVYWIPKSLREEDDAAA